MSPLNTPEESHDLTGWLDLLQGVIVDTAISIGCVLMALTLTLAAVWGAT